MARNNQGGGRGGGLREFLNELLAEITTRGLFGWLSPQQAQPAAPQVVIQPGQPGAAAVNVMNAAAGIGGRAFHQVGQAAGQIAAQAVPLAQRAGRGFAAAVDDAWVLPARVIAGFYLVYTTCFFVVVFQVQQWMNGLGLYYPAATHGWYTFALAIQLITAVTVFALGLIAVTNPTPGDRLNYPATMWGVLIILVSIPLAPLAMGSAIASAIHSARLNHVPIGYLAELQVWGDVFMIAGTVLVMAYVGIVISTILTSDFILDTLRGKNVPLERATAYVKGVPLVLLALILGRYAAMLYWPSVKFLEEFLNRGIFLVVLGLVLFAATKISVEIKTWQRVAIGFLIMIVATVIWNWIFANHGLEVYAVGTQVAGQRPLLDQAWDWVKAEWIYNQALPHLSFGVLRGLGKGTIYLVLFLAAGFYAIGGYERVSKSGRVGQLIGLVALLILAPCALVCLSEVLGILLGWAHAL